ncbi:MAG: hypothetical protein DMG35_15675 [Acidobacteria bacterium]|nr:MAG: hypothetical protein AUH86_08485 [Acidobacteria bacterium 13_1_40CM_4_58_4]PYT59042.1 MAG: hypothetical protein DMG35_15675 [Acidobacteriota bacterium]
MGLLSFMREVSGAPCYRRSLSATAKYGYAKWVLSRFRENDPEKFLQGLGVRASRTLRGYEQWRPELERVVHDVQQASDGQGGVSSADGLVLYGLVRALEPDYVVETGVAAGVSTSYIGAGLIDNGHGHLFSIELPPAEELALVCADGSRYIWQDRGVGWAIPASIRAGLGGRHRLILRDVRKALAELLREIPYVDIFFHDDLHAPEHMLWEYSLVWPRIRPGGVLVSDDSNYGWIQFCRELRRGEEGFPNLDRLTALRKGLRTAPSE